MDHPFPRYLLAKQSVDDRALNRSVLDALRAELPRGSLHIVEAGAGVGTMLARLLRWQVFAQGAYVAVDESQENIDYALSWIPQWATDKGLRTRREPENHLRLWDESRDLQVKLERANVLDFAAENSALYDLLIAHAFLDLLPMPEALTALLRLLHPGGLAWLTLNFDGVTSLLPTLDAELDARIERLYHASMDARPTGGGSQTGSQLFGYLERCGAKILAAGASDWLVVPRGGKYPADERYFLDFILGFFEQSLSGHTGLDPQQFARWLASRRAQVERGELIYNAHQVDFLVRV